MKKPRVLIWVQNLLGTGHVRRAATLGQGLAQAGFDCTIATGDAFNTPIPRMDGLSVLPLLPVRAADATFSRLIGADGSALPTDWMERRSEHLRDHVATRPPDVVIVELFPFGRRAFRDELAALLDRSRTLGAHTFCSIRDILADKRKPERVAETLVALTRWFDSVLVHSDPAIVPLAATFPASDRIAAKLRYTGYVLDRGRLPPPGDGAEVIVAAGGAEGGADLLRAAMAARLAGTQATRPWRLLVPPALGQDLLLELRSMAPPGMIVEPTRPDFPDLLAQAGLVIARAGYNTVLECVALRRRTVCVPFAAANETEQTLRSRLFGACGLVVDSTLDGLPQACAQALAKPAPDRTIDLDGVAATVRLVRNALAPGVQR